MAAEEKAGERAAKILYATRRVRDLTEYMSQDPPEGLGLWKEMGHAGAFLAAYSLLAGKKPVGLDPKSNPEHKLVNLTNFFSLQKSISDIAELAAIHLAVGGDQSVDATLNDIMPGLMEAGADELEELLRGPDVLPNLVGRLRELEKRHS